MSISGTTKALMASRVGLLRLGASRLDYLPTIAVIVSINGTTRTTNTLIESLEITDTFGAEPSTCRFTCKGFTPVVGHEVIIAIGHLTNRVFAGHIQVMEQERVGAATPLFHVSCVDYTVMLDRHLVTAGEFPYTNVTLMIRTVLDEWAPTFTYVHVDANLPYIGPVMWDTPQPISAVLNGLAEKLGAYWYVDYNKDVHFYLSESLNPPATLAITNKRFTTITLTTDQTQIRTKVRAHGARASASLAARPGSTSVIAVDQEWMFLDMTAGFVLVAGVPCTAALLGPTAKPLLEATAASARAVGATTIGVTRTQNFGSTGGFARIGSQVCRYTGLSVASGSGTLTGVPAAGIGSIVNAIVAGDIVYHEPSLSIAPIDTGVWWLDPFMWDQGASVQVYHDASDAGAIAALTAVDGSDGIAEVNVEDNNLNYTGCVQRALVELANLKSNETGITFEGDDQDYRAGRTVTASLGSPYSIAGSWLIQEVTISNFNLNAHKWPRRSCRAAPFHRTFVEIFKFAVIGALKRTS